jgi:hypothetical protein
MLLPAFSTKSVKANEQTIHKYIDMFVQKMKEISKVEEGIELKQVSVKKQKAPLKPLLKMGTDIS